jgi:hypothetical protein
MSSAAVALLLLPVVAAAAAPAQAPHLIMALTDDLGWNYPGYHNPEVVTPTLDQLAKEGVRLESHYTYKYCAPTRGSFLTGRFPYHLAATRCNLIPSSIPEGTDLGYTMLPKLLATQGYVSHHVGKWCAKPRVPQCQPPQLSLLGCTLAADRAAACCCCCRCRCRCRCCQAPRLSYS